MTAWKARFRNGDNTLWSSFRISDKEVADARQRLRSNKSCFSREYLSALQAYIIIKIRKAYLSIFMPDEVTKYYAFAALMVNIGSIVVSTSITNFGDYNLTVPIFLICGINIFFVIDIALLLMPHFQTILRPPLRLDMVFAAVFVIICTTVFYWGDGNGSFLIA